MTVCRTAVVRSEGRRPGPNGPGRSFLDSNILVYTDDRTAKKKRAAGQSGCKRLLSEDMQDGRCIGEVEIRNPFSGL